MLDINSLIQNAMKSRNKTELQAYQNLKAEIQKFKTMKNAKPYDEAAELAIISKYCKSLEDAIRQFSEAHRDDLVASYTAEWDVLKKLLPEPVTAEDVKSYFEMWLIENAEKGILESYNNLPKKEMGNAIKYLKSKFPTADGKMISNIVKKYIV